MDHDATRRDGRQGDEPSTTGEDGDEYVVFPSDEPRMTAYELLADAAARTAAAVDAAVRARADVVTGCTRAMRALLDYLDEPLLIEVQCPCCGALYDPVAYVQHVTNPPGQCDRERWALVLTADETNR